MANTTPNKYQAKQADTNGLIPYDTNENQIWGELYHTQSKLVKQHMVREYVAGLDLIDMPADRVPQCQEVSAKLKKINGWQVQPVPSLIGYDRFYHMLANKVFPAASFIRDRTDFHYVTEPDIFHELFGHAPLLTHPTVVRFSQFIGKLGCSVSAEYHAWLARLYWFTLEFSLIKQANDSRSTDMSPADNYSMVPMGAAIASSPTEVVYAAISPQPQRRPFDVVQAMTTPILFGIKQPVYYVLESFDQLLEISERDLLADILTAKKLGLQVTQRALI